MKKALIIIFVLLAFAGIAAGLYFGVSRSETGELLFAGMTSAELESLAKEKIIPIATGAVSATAALYVSVAPALAKLKNASGKLESATRDVRSASEDALQSKRHVGELERTLTEELERINGQYGDVERRLGRIEHAMLLAFANQRELVANGSAGRIAEVLEDSGRESVKDEAAEQDKQAEA